MQTYENSARRGPLNVSGSQDLAGPNLNLKASLPTTLRGTYGCLRSATGALLRDEPMFCGVCCLAGL